MIGTKTNLAIGGTVILLNGNQRLYKWWTNELYYLESVRAL